MSDPNQPLASSTDNRDLTFNSQPLTTQGILPDFLTIPRKTLKDNLNPRVSLPFKVLDLVTNNPTDAPQSTTFSTPTILNDKGQIDVNRFAIRLMLCKVQHFQHLQS